MLVDEAVLWWVNLLLQAWEQMEPVIGISAGDMQQVVKHTCTVLQPCITAIKSTDKLT